MSEKVKDWIEKWKTDCGTVKEPDDVLLVLKEQEKEIYVGHFLDVPETLHERPVYSNSRVCESSDPRRKDAYVLEVGKEKLQDKISGATENAGKDKYLESLYNTLEMCDLVLQNSQVLPDEQVVKAQKLRKKTQENIQKREAIPFERRI